MEGRHLLDKSCKLKKRCKVYIANRPGAGFTESCAINFSLLENQSVAFHLASLNRICHWGALPIFFAPLLASRAGDPKIFP